MSDHEVVKAIPLDQVAERYGDDIADLAEIFHAPLHQWGMPILPR